MNEQNTRCIDASGPPVRLDKTASKQGGNYLAKADCRAPSLQRLSDGSAVVSSQPIVDGRSGPVATPAMDVRRCGSNATPSVSLMAAGSNRPRHASHAAAGLQIFYNIFAGPSDRSTGARKGISMGY